MNRTCRDCGRTWEGEQEIEKNFYSVGGTKKHLRRTICKKCSDEKVAEWRRKNPEKWEAIHQRATRAAAERGWKRKPKKESG